MPPSSRRRQIEYRPIALTAIKTAIYVGIAWLAILVLLPLMLAVQAG